MSSDNTKSTAWYSDIKRSQNEQYTILKKPEPIDNVEEHDSRGYMYCGYNLPRNNDNVQRTGYTRPNNNNEYKDDNGGTSLLGQMWIISERIMGITIRCYKVEQSW